MIAEQSPFLLEEGQNFFASKEESFMEIKLSFYEEVERSSMNLPPEAGLIGFPLGRMSS